MASLTIRNIDDQLKQKLKVRAARNGLSVEEDLRRVLKDLVSNPMPTRQVEAGANVAFQTLKAMPEASAQATAVASGGQGQESPFAVASRPGAFSPTSSTLGDEAVRERVARVLVHARRPDEPIDWKAVTDELYDFLP